MATSPVLFVYYPPLNDDAYPGVPGRHITEADWASFTIAQRRTIENATTQEGYTRRKVWVHRDLVDETEQERADREAAEAAARAAFDRANSLVRYGQIESMIEQLEVLPPAEEFAALRADVDAVADVPPRVEAVEQTVSTVAPKAERADSRVFDVRAYGAVGDWDWTTRTGTDDTSSLQACANAARAAGGTFFIPQHLRCRITSEVNLRHIRDVDVRGSIIVSHTSGVGVLVGDSSQEGVRPTKILLNEVAYGTSEQTNVAVRVVGLKRGHVSIHNCPYLQLYADTSDSSLNSIAYSDFWFGNITKHELFGVTGTSWINENRFHGGRVQHIVVSGAYPHNNNRWYDANLEDSTITFNTGQSNYIRARLESGSTITFAAPTHSNRVVQTYYATRGNSWPASNIAVTDLGFDNKVVTQKQEAAVYVPVIRVDSASRTTDTASAWSVNHATRRILPGFRKLKMPNNATDYLDTGIFPLDSTSPAPTVEGGVSTRTFRIISDVSVWRPLVWVYDANRTLLDGGSGGPYIETSGGWAWSTNDGGRYSIGVNVGTSVIRLVFNNPAVKYARIVLRGNDTTTPFRYVEIGALVQAPHGTQIVDLIRRQMARPLAQTSATPPTQSLLHKGDTIGTDTGQLLVTHRVDTTLSAAATSGATDINVASGAGIAIGDNIAVLLADDTTHFTTVASIATNTITLTEGLTGAANAGANVATQRWTHLA